VPPQLCNASFVLNHHSERLRRFGAAVDEGFIEAKYEVDEWTILFVRRIEILTRTASGPLLAFLCKVHQSFRVRIIPLDLC
jgi:hypothetical protein